MPVTRITAVKENSVNGDDFALFRWINNRLHMGLVVNEVAMGQGSFRALRFSLSVSQPVLYIFLSNTRRMDSGSKAVVSE